MNALHAFVLGACASLTVLDWLPGDWVAERGSRTVRETWTAVSDTTFEGEGSGETLRLVEMSGGVFYLAKVAENPLPVAFRLTECGAGHAVFENPEHDFPKRLEYRLSGERLHVRVSDGGERGFTLELVRRP